MTHLFRILILQMNYQARRICLLWLNVWLLIQSSLSWVKETLVCGCTRTLSLKAGLTLSKG